MCVCVVTLVHRIHHPNGRLQFEGVYRIRNRCVLLQGVYWALEDRAHPTIAEIAINLVFFYSFVSSAYFTIGRPREYLSQSV